MTDQVQIITRGPSPDDVEFIMATWLKGNRFGNPYFEKIAAEDYYRDYSLHIQNVIKKPETEIRVACDVAHPDWIVGYAIFAAPNLHWIYVKETYRKKGIATLLLKDIPITTAKGFGKIGLSILQKKGLIFDPR